MFFHEKLSKLLFRLSNISLRAAKVVYQTSQEKQLILWKNCNGDGSLRLEYELNPDSIVFDLGGYEGQWASDIFAKYCCTIYVFEPVNLFADRIKKRFEYNSKIKVFNIGLSNENSTKEIGIENDSSSIFKITNNTTNIELIEAKSFLINSNIGKIDLMKINIEGGEYDLLEHLIDSKFIVKIVNIQVQFHDFFPNAESRMLSIQENLSKTHYLTYSFPFIWENWKLKTR
jgi:FkbM family methyltransferase